MLWLKYWYETRIRFFLLLAAIPVVSALASDSNSKMAPTESLGATTLIGVSIVAAVMLAGDSIKTQAGGFRRSKGLHG
jgi:hypothetical protein